MTNLKDLVLAILRQKKSLNHKAVLFVSFNANTAICFGDNLSAKQKGLTHFRHFYIFNHTSNFKLSNMTVTFKCARKNVTRKVEVMMLLEMFSFPQLCVT